MPHDFDRLLADMKRLDARARVGALDEANAQKLNWMEFGTIDEEGQQRIQPRPTLTVAFDRTKATMRRVIDRKIGAVIDGKSHAVLGYNQCRESGLLPAGRQHAGGLGG